MKHLIPCFYGDYGKKLNKDRQMPLYNDSLRPVERRLLLTLHEEAPNKFKKSSSIIGTLIAKYHPHGDLSAYETLQNLVIGGYAVPQGQWGGRGLDGKESPAAHRYTEIKAAKWIEELAFKYINYVPWDNIEFSNEPLVLPSPVPIGLVGYSNLVGITFDTTKIPKYKLADLAKRLSWLLKQEGEEPIITPNFRDCVSKEASTGEYKKILNEGSGTLKVVPNGRIIDNTIHIEGVVPGRTFKSLRYHSDPSNKNRKLNVRLIDDSGSEEDPFSINILVDPIKKNTDLKELFKTIWKEYLISNVEYKCVFTDYEGKLHKLGIDDILINNYRIWVTSVLRERTHVYNKLNNQKYYLTIVYIIKETLDQSNKKIKKVDDLISEYRNIYKNIPKIKLKQFDIETKTFEDFEYELSEEEIKKTCRSHSITKLIEIDTDFQDLEKQILDQRDKINDTEKDCFNYVNDLGQEKINF